MADDVIATMVTTALDGGRVLDLLPMVQMLPPEPLRLVAEVVAGRSDAQLDELAAQVHAARRWDALLPLAAAFDPPALCRLARLPVFTTDGVVAEVIATTARTGRWDLALPLADALPDELRPAAAAGLDTLTAEQLQAAVAGAIRSDHLPALTAIAVLTAPAVRKAVAEQAEAAGRPDLAATLLGGS